MKIECPWNLSSQILLIVAVTVLACAAPEPTFDTEKLRELAALEAVLEQRLVADFNTTLREGPSSARGRAGRTFRHELRALKDKNAEIWATPDSSTVMLHVNGMAEAYSDLDRQLQWIAAARHNALVLLDAFYVLAQETIDARASPSDLVQIQAKWDQWGMDVQEQLGYFAAGELLGVGVRFLFGSRESPEQAKEMLDLLGDRLRVGDDDIVGIHSSWTTVGDYRIHKAVRYSWWIDVGVQYRAHESWAAEDPMLVSTESGLRRFEGKLDDLERKQDWIDFSELDDELNLLGWDVRSAEGSRLAWEVRRRLERMREAQFLRELFSVEVRDAESLLSYYRWPPELDPTRENLTEQRRQFLIRAQ